MEVDFNFEKFNSLRVGGTSIYWSCSGYIHIGGAVMKATKGKNLGQNQYTITMHFLIFDH